MKAGRRKELSSWSRPVLLAAELLRAVVVAVLLLLVVDILWVVRWSSAEVARQTR